MIKATRKISANAELARAFADIFRAPTHEEGAVLSMLFAQNERIPNEWAAMRERVSAEQRVALIIRPDMIKAASQRPSECHARMSIRKAFGERPHMSMKGFFAQNAQKRPGMRMGGALRERACAQQCVALIMIKATRKVDANAELARAFADIFRVPTHEE